jgi:hypothetical protein
LFYAVRVKAFKEARGFHAACHPPALMEAAWDDHFRHQHRWAADNSSAWSFDAGYLCQ